MKICKVCKIENEEQFVYCKNCGAQLEVAPAAPVQSSEPVCPPASSENKEQPAAGSAYAGVEQNTYVVADNKPVTPITVPSGLVAVEMMLPDPANPDIRCVQTVYVTPAQKAAIQYYAIKMGRKI